MSDITHSVILLDGRKAECWEADRQEYSDTILSAGLVEGIPPDSIFLRLHRGLSEEPTYIFLRPDEALSVINLLSGALWSKSILELSGEE
jgi:hypothetical protein